MEVTSCAILLILSRRSQEKFSCIAHLTWNFCPAMAIFKSFLPKEVRTELQSITKAIRWESFTWASSRMPVTRWDSRRNMSTIPCSTLTSKIRCSLATILLSLTPNIKTSHSKKLLTAIHSPTSLHLVTTRVRCSRTHSRCPTATRWACSLRMKSQCTSSMAKLIKSNRAIKSQPETEVTKQARDSSLAWTKLRSSLKSSVEICLLNEDLTATACYNSSKLRYKAECLWVSLN